MNRRMVGIFDALRQQGPSGDKMPLNTNSRFCFQTVTIAQIHLIAMAMALGDRGRVVDIGNLESAFNECAR